MGTRGYLVFRRKGRKIVIYNHFDSYPSAMGAEIFRQLALVLQRFNGDASKACVCWGKRVSNLVLASLNDGAEARHPFNQIHAFDDIEGSLSSTVPVAVCDEDSLDAWIEYVWTLDLDEGTLEMRAHGGSAIWSFAAIHRGRGLMDKWVDEAEREAQRNDVVVDQDDVVGRPFMDAVEAAAAVAIQASARRFLEVSRGLRPGGVLMRLAAKRFRRACVHY